MNVVDESITEQEQMANITSQSKLLFQYLPVKGMTPGSRFDPKMVKFLAAQDIVASYDHVFDR